MLRIAAISAEAAGVVYYWWSSSAVALAVARSGSSLERLMFAGNGISVCHYTSIPLHFNAMQMGCYVRMGRVPPWAATQHVLASASSLAILPCGSLAATSLQRAVTILHHAVAHPIFCSTLLLRDIELRADGVGLAPHILISAVESDIL